LKSILYTKNFDEKIQEPVNVILSPEFYWIKKVDAKVKSLKDLKKMAKNLFKLDEKKYLFDAFFLNGKPFVVAIEKNLNLKIPKKYVHSVRIAQIELYGYDCVSVKEKTLRKIDDLLFCFPEKSECKKIDEILKEIKLSNKKFSIYEGIDKGILIPLLLIFLSVNAALILFGVKNLNDAKEIKNQRLQFLKNHNLPLTNLQLESILEDIKSQNAKQIKIKKDLEYITLAPLKKGEYFTVLKFDGDKFYIKIKSSKNLDEYFMKKFKILKSTYDTEYYKAVLK